MKKASCWLCVMCMPAYMCVYQSKPRIRLAFRKPPYIECSGKENHIDL